MDILEIIDDREQMVAENVSKPFACPADGCGKSFNRKSDLQRHHRIHTNERPYACNWSDCGKSFIQRSALTVHIRTHTGEKPHHCEYIGCGKAFSDSSSLARHRRIHTGKRPYSCPCGKSFCRKTTLTKHARKTHTSKGDHDMPVDEESETDEESSPSPHAQKARAQWKGESKVMARRNNTSLSAKMLQPMKLDSLQTLRPGNHTRMPAASESYLPSISLSDMHHPPTPSSPFYSDDELRGITPSMTPREEEFDPMHHGGSSMPGSASYDNLKIVCTPQTPHQLLATHQHNMQASPGSLSSCSSVSNASSTSDYFYRATHSAGPYTHPSGLPLSPLGMPQYTQTPVPSHQHSQPQHHQQSATTTPIMQSHQASDMWFPFNPYQTQGQMMLAPPQHPQQPRVYYASIPSSSDMGYIKAESENHMMLPTPRASFCG